MAAMQARTIRDVPFSRRRPRGLIFITRIAIVPTTLAVFVLWNFGRHRSDITTQDALSSDSSSTSTAHQRVDVTSSSTTVSNNSNSQNKKRCSISSRGTDGAGHQMEAKFSCLATAMALNMTYVHHPITQLEHGTDAAEMEDLFGFSRVILPVAQQQERQSSVVDRALMFDYATMRDAPRQPLPWVGRCLEQSWFDRNRDNSSGSNICAEEQENAVMKVYTSDNCWDYFWCHIETIPASFWSQTVPMLRKSFLDGPQLSTIREKAKKHDTRKHVVMHIRLGDAKMRKSNTDWNKRVLASLLQADPNLRVTIHSDGSHAEVIKLIGENDSGKDGIQIFGKGDDGATIQQVLYEMVTADVLVSADSSFSHVAALLRGKQSPVIHPETDDRVHIVTLGWHMVRAATRTSQSHLEVCRALPTRHERTCSKWEAADATFWRNIMVSSR
jgi:hypothetical protein